MNAIPKCPPSSFVANYLPISITSVLSNVFECWYLFILDDSLYAMVCFQPPSLLIRKVWVPVMHFCVCPIHCKVHWRVGRRLGLIDLIDFSATFDWVNYQGILYRLCSVGIRGSVLSLLTQFLSNRSQRIMVGGCRSKLVDVLSGVPMGSVLGLLLFLLYTSELFSILENKLTGYADDSTLMAVVPSPGVRVTVRESLICDLGRVSKWCDLWGMKLNAS